MKLKCLSDNRDLILQVLKRETGANAVYCGLPEFSYTVGRYRLLRNGYIEYDVADTSGFDTNMKDGSNAESDRTSGHDSLPHAIASLVSLNLCEPPPGSVKVGAPIHTGSAHGAPIHGAPPLSHLAEHDPPAPSYPLRDHSGRTLLNLFCIISARQNLLNRALDARGAFFIARSLMEELLAHPPETISDFMRGIYDRENEYRGVHFVEDRILLTGFRKGWSCEEPIHRQLADLIMQAALERRWIKPFTRNVRNRKYYFRIWLNTLGMTGPDYETARQVLLSRLPGRADQRKIPREKPAFGRTDAKEV